MDHSNTILGQIEPDITQRLVSRREAIWRGAAVGSSVAAGLALASAPLAFAALTREAFTMTEEFIASNRLSAVI